jgi:hypothetical protein
MIDYLYVFEKKWMYVKKSEFMFVCVLVVWWYFVVFEYWYVCWLVDDYFICIFVYVW